MSDNAPSEPTSKALSAANIVSRLARKYGDVALPNTNKQFVIVPDETPQVMYDNRKLAEDTVSKLNVTTADDSDLARNVLEAMARIDLRTTTRAYTDIGVVIINPADAQKSPILSEKNEVLEHTIAILHELGHVNMGYLRRLQDGSGMSDIQVLTTPNNNFRVVTGWERDMPKELLSNLRKMLGHEDIIPSNESEFKSKADYQAYLDVVKDANLDSINDSVSTLRSLVSETYADAFAVLSYAAKDGPVAGSAVAEQIYQFRTKEAADGFSNDSHDTSRGIAWLSSYLKSSSGEKLIANLQSSEDIAESAQKIHQSAKMFVSINVRRWAKDYGMPLENAEKLSQWVSTYFQKAEDINMEKINPTVISREPEVHNFSKDAIIDLALKSAIKSVPVERDDTQRVMEYSKTAK